MNVVAQPASKESAVSKDSAKHAFAAPAFYSALDSSVFQRKTCPCGGGCPRCAAKAEQISAPLDRSQPETGLDPATIARPLQFQPIFGNPGGTCRLQTKLTVNTPGDQYEQEADRVAEQVMRMPEGSPVMSQTTGVSPGLQRKCSCGGTCDQCSEEHDEPVRLQRTGGSSLGQMEAPPIVHEVLRDPGQPLDAATRAFMEPRFGQDFSRVRVHTDEKAEEASRAVKAKAFTVGNNIVFGANQFRPSAIENRGLVAHELAHVLQQSPGQRQLQRWATCTPARAFGTECPPRESGEVARAREGPMAVANVADDPVLGTGETGVLIANFDIGSAAIKPSLHGTEVWKKFLKKIAADRSQWKIVGFTDCEGNESVNHQLRKERAKALYKTLPKDVQSQITSVEAAPTNECVTENDSASDRTKNRSVALILVTDVVNFADEEVEPVKLPELVCGPDVTHEVAAAVELTKSLFNGWNKSQQGNACDALGDYGVAGCAWDIVQLHNRGWMKGFQPVCATPLPGDPDLVKCSKCECSVQIDDDCHYAGSANYVIFGVMCKLCGMNISDMRTLIDIYKGTKWHGFGTPSPNFGASVAWANAGYHGWPSGSSSPRGDRGNCALMCPRPYSGSAFQIHWYPNEKTETCGR